MPLVLAVVLLMSGILPQLSSKGRLEAAVKKELEDRGIPVARVDLGRGRDPQEVVRKGERLWVEGDVMIGADQIDTCYNGTVTLKISGKHLTILVFVLKNGRFVYLLR
ncbi:MAG: hypothetical protein FJ304_00480 [Planctomycetes bacterium]|nr:hypothetical protein [Planctomycetota bacterium]